MMSNIYKYGKCKTCKKEHQPLVFMNFCKVCYRTQISEIKASKQIKVIKNGVRKRNKAKD